MSAEPDETEGFLLGYFQGWSDHKAHRQYGEGRTARSGLNEALAWTVPPEHRPRCAVSNEPCTSWTCLVDRCVDIHNDCEEGSFSECGGSNDEH